MIFLSNKKYFGHDKVKRISKGDFIYSKKELEMRYLRQKMTEDLSEIYSEREVNKIVNINHINDS